MFVLRFGDPRTPSELPSPGPELTPKGRNSLAENQVRNKHTRAGTPKDPQGPPRAGTNTQVRWVAQQCGPRAGLPGLVWAGRLMRTDQNPIPNCPGLRPGILGQDLGNNFPAKAGPKPALKARSVDRKDY